MSELSLSVVVGGQTVRGMLHLPEAAPGPVPAVIWVHGFRGNRAEAHRSFVDGARRLAARGIASFRFDFRGCGESDGDFVDLTISSMLEDLRAALQALRDRPEIDERSIALVGISLGCAIASQLGTQADLKAMVFWSPVVFSVPIFARMGLYAAHPELARQGWIDAGGYRVGRQFLAELPALDPLGALAVWEKPLYVLYGGGDVVTTSENAEALISEVPGATGECNPQADHVFGTVPWRTWVLDRTEKFVSEQLLGVSVC
jgi:pimeloyl-ACP methyl ester carboxylesterase